MPRKKAHYPKTLVDLADALSVELDDGRQIKFHRSGRYSLCSTRSGSQLWIVSRLGAKNVRASTDKKAERLFEDFTGFEHDENALMVSIPQRNMIKIGRAINIVYRSDKFSKGGKTSDYIHPFEKFPTVSVDNKNRPTIVALRGGAIMVKQEGVTG